MNVSYISSIDFGETVNPNGFIDSALGYLPKLGSVDARQVLQDLYEVAYGICDHMRVSKKRPLAGVGYHESEDPSYGSGLEESMETYIKYDIKEIYNISYIEYMNLPVDITAVMRKVASKEGERRSKSLSSFTNSMTTPSK